VSLLESLTGVLASPLAAHARFPDLQHRMRAVGFDALVLTQPGACVFAAGHDRVGVLNGSAGTPLVVLTSRGDPHVLTSNPDGALHLDEAAVHALSWNMTALYDDIERWIAGYRRPDGSATIGVDVASPRTLEALAELPNVVIADASALLAEAMLVKTDAERAALAGVCALAHRAVKPAQANDFRGVTDILGGAFPIAPWHLAADRVSIAISHDGFAGEARVGPGDAVVLRAALDCLVDGISAAALAASLPAGVEVVGIGRGFELPIIHAGIASPVSLVLRTGAVLVVRHHHAAVTACMTANGYELVSPAPEEVVIDVSY
jgi:Trk K+ transport system NAD-binding subunit